MHGNLDEKCRAPDPRPTPCVSLRGRKAFQHATRAALYRNLQETYRAPKPRPTLCASQRSRNACQHFTRATHFTRKFTGKMPRPSWSTLIKHRRLRKNPAIYLSFGGLLRNYAGRFLGQRTFQNDFLFQNRRRSNAV